MNKKIEEKLKAEALQRMKALKLHDEGFHTCVGDFRKNGTAWKSEFYGALYWLDEDEQKIVKDFEQKHKYCNLKVYHCYKGHYKYGEILYMFYVTSDKCDTFRNFQQDLNHGYIFGYAHNITEPMFSKFGSCGIKSMFGGIQVC